MKKIVFFLLSLLQMTLFGGTNPLYEIRGDSPSIDSNLTCFLHRWREVTTAPIADGNYTNTYLHGETGRAKRVALTFDDSPDENNTGKILDILKASNVKASFFMIASTMEESNATLVKRAFDEGHLVLNHSFTHPHLDRLCEDEIIHQLNSASERIEKITGHYPLLIRPPYGNIDKKVIDTVNAKGYKTILWSLDSLDWAIKEPEPIIDNVIANIHPGDIILMHSSRANLASVRALPRIIELLRNQGYTFERVDEMLGIQAYR